MRNYTTVLSQANEELQFKSNCPYAYKECGLNTNTKHSDCEKCFVENKYDIHNGHSFENYMKEEEKKFKDMCLSLTGHTR